MTGLPDAYALHHEVPEMSSHYFGQRERGVRAPSSGSVLDAGAF